MKTIKHLLLFCTAALYLSACKTKTQETSSAFTVGQKYEGGIIFFIDPTEKHGLIAAPTDLNQPLAWGCNGSSIPGTTVFNGAGISNTALIIAHCPKNNTPAQLCSDLVIDGYSDWFLPSRNELNLLYLQKDLIGNFVNNYYWSSTQYDAYSSWAQHFFNGNHDNNGKYTVARVRAIRAF